jgi:hypothetical protein
VESQDRTLYTCESKFLEVAASKRSYVFVFYVNDCASIYLQTSFKRNSWVVMTTVLDLGVRK